MLKIHLKDLAAKGTVIDVEVFTRDGVEKDERTQAIEQDHLINLKKMQMMKLLLLSRQPKLDYVTFLRARKLLKVTALKKVRHFLLKG